MLSDDVSEHQILKIFLGGGMPPEPPRWAANAALSAFGGASAPQLQNYFLRLCSNAIYRYQWNFLQGSRHRLTDGSTMGDWCTIKVL